MAEETNAFPSPESKGKKKNGKFVRRRLCFVLLMILFIWWFNNYTLKVTKVTLHSDKVKNSMRIAVISDLHATHHSISNRRIEKKIRRADPDLVMVLGDMYTSESPWDRQQIAVDLIGDIVDEGFPVYFVSGEHDNDQDYLKAVADTGAHVMNYEYDIIEVNGNKVQIMGIDNVYYSDTFDLRNEFSIKESCYNILLAHIPNYEKFAAFGADLTLCADTHGGMMQLPFDMGPVYSSDYNSWFPQLTMGGETIYDKGLFEYDGGNMFITSGIGDSPAPVRFNNRPEIAVIDIEP
ncbi:MAG TPA: metallophosphoesterase [Ruminococcus sp.]|nr:metallophosphoesterase [Ruminococcus sp.]